jgi:hypothetical protein
VLNLGGALSVAETVEVVRRSKLYVGPDTGTTWLACVAEETPKICLIAPKRHEVTPVGFEGHVPGKIKDVTYAIKEDELVRFGLKMARKDNAQKRKARKKTIDVLLIVLNGEPWLEAWLKTYRDFADRIVVVEGADGERFDQLPPLVRDKLISSTWHSKDNTLDVLSDADADLILLYREDGRWENKDQMTVTASEHLRGDYVLEADVDEFYFQTDLAKMRELVTAQPEVAVWMSPHYNFWKGGDFCTKETAGRIWHERQVPRLFKWVPGRKLLHRPPRVEPVVVGPSETFPFPFFHYNYVLEKDAEYKRYYHREDIRWFEYIWRRWSPNNRVDLTHGIQPDGKGEKTELVQYKGEHPEFAAKVLEQLKKEGKI